MKPLTDEEWLETLPWDDPTATVADFEPSLRPRSDRTAQEVVALFLSVDFGEDFLPPSSLSSLESCTSYGEEETKPFFRVSPTVPDPQPKMPGLFRRLWNALFPE